MSRDAETAGRAHDPVAARRTGGTGRAAGGGENDDARPGGLRLFPCSLMQLNRDSMIACLDGSHIDVFHNGRLSAGTNDI